jgi:hypothetical protein
VHLPSADGIISCTTRNQLQGVQRKKMHNLQLFLDK